MAVCLRGFSVGSLPHHSQSSNPRTPLLSPPPSGPAGNEFCMLVSHRRVRQEYQSFSGDSSDLFKFSFSLKKFLRCLMLHL